eukprot:2630252-Alexandrium_andersonii.AAC.1
MTSPCNRGSGIHCSAASRACPEALNGATATGEQHCAAAGVPNPAIAGASHGGATRARPAT